MNIYLIENEQRISFWSKIKKSFNEMEIWAKVGISFIKLC